jgi:hypothetical protein
MDQVSAAARTLLGMIARAGKASWAATFEFQKAFNRSGLPLFTGTDALTLDGIYGPLTQQALLAVVYQSSATSAARSAAVSGRAPRYATGGFDLGDALVDIAATAIPALQQVKEPLKQAAHAVESAAPPVIRQVADPVMSATESVLSLIPGIGTGLSAAIGAAQGLLDGGSPLDVAIHAAYAMIPIPPGLRQVCDPIVDALLGLADGKQITDVALQVIRDRLPEGLPRDVFDTLVHVIAGSGKPIVKDTSAKREHMVASYTQGHAAAVDRGLARHVPARVSKSLEGLPPSHAKFPPAARAGPAPRPPGSRVSVSLAPAERSSAPPGATSRSRPAPARRAAIATHRTRPAPPRPRPPAPAPLAQQSHTYDASAPASPDSASQSPT